MFFKNIFRKKYSKVNELETPLARCLNLFDLTLLTISGMIGSGIYVLTGVVAKEYTGPAIIVANLLAGLACLSGACCYAEFAARIPRAGSSYIFIYESIGEIIAFLVGFSMIIGGLTGLGVSARVWSTYFDALFHDGISSFIKNSIIQWTNAPKPLAKYPDLLAFTIIFLLFIALLSGLKNSKWLTNGLTVLNISSLLFIGVTGFLLGRPENYRPFAPFGISKIIHGSSLLLYSYIGFEMATVAIEEAKNPSRTVPQATVMSLVIVGCLYSLAGSSLTYLIPSKDISTESAFARAYLSSSCPWISSLISVAIVFSAGGNLLSGAYGTIRIIYAMSIDGLLPSKLSYVNVKRQVPVVATLFACIFIALLATFFDIKDLIGFSDISALLSYTGVSIGLLVERYDHQSTYQIVLADENEQEEEELFALEEMKTDINRNLAEVQLDRESFFTRFARRLCHCYLSSIDSHLSPKLSSGIFLIIFIVNTSLMSTFLVYLFDRTCRWHLFILVLFLIIDSTMKFLFCLLRPKMNPKTLLFTCPGVPLIPLININIFIFLMAFQDRLDWLVYLIILMFSLLIYFSYGYRHSKSR